MICVAAGMTMLSAANAAAAVLSGWSSASSMPTARQALAAVASGKTIFALGGSTGGHSGYLPSVEAYSVSSGAWTARAPMPTPRDGLAAVKGADGRIYAIGGDNSGWGGALSTVEAYTLARNSWAAVAPLPTPLTGTTGVKGPDGRIYVFGGERGTFYYGDAYAYSASSNIWATLRAMPTARYYACAAAGRDGRIYVFGGWNNLVGGHLATVEAYDPASDTWSSLPNMPTARQGCTAIAVGAQIYVIGGQNWSGMPTGVDVYSTKTRRWTTTTDLPAGRAYLAGVKASDGRIYAIGGTPDTIAPLASVGVLG